MRLRVKLIRAVARIRWVAGGLCLALPQAIGAAQQPSEQSFESAVALTREGRYEDALKNFLAAEAAGDHSARLYFNLGVVNYRLQRFDAARAAFAHASQDPETADLAEYNRGLVALADGDGKEATRWFRRVAQRAPEPSLRALAQRALARAEGRTRVAAEPPRRGSLSMLRGWDSNVVVPVGAITNLPSLSRDEFTEARFAWVDALGDGIPGLGYRLSALAVEYDDIQVADIAALEAGIDWRGPILIDASLSMLAVGDNSYQHSLDVRLQAPVVDLDWLRVNADGGWSRLDPMDDRAKDLEGSRYSFGGSIDAGIRPLSLNFGYRHLINDRVAASLSPDQDRYTLRFRFALPRWVVRVWGRYVESDYPTDRQDEERDFGVDVALKVHPRLELLLEASRLQNRSSDSRYDYSTERISTGLRVLF